MHQRPFKYTVLPFDTKGNPLIGKSAPTKLAAFRVARSMLKLSHVGSVIIEQGDLFVSNLKKTP